MWLDATWKAICKKKNKKHKIQVYIKCISVKFNCK